MDERARMWAALKRRADGVDGFMWPGLKMELQWAVVEIEQLRAGLLEALEWNWLDADRPVLGEQLRALAEGRAWHDDSATASPIEKI